MLTVGFETGLTEEQAEWPLSVNDDSDIIRTQDVGKPAMLHLNREETRKLIYDLTLALSNWDYMLSLQQ